MAILARRAVLMAACGVAPLSAVAAGGSVTLTRRTAVEEFSGSATPVYNIADIGAADTDRVVIFGIACHAASNRTLTGVTLNTGAINATLIQGMSGSANPILALYAAVVPTGTSCTIEPTFSSTTDRTVCVVWTITGDPATAYTARGSANTQSVADTVTTDSMSIPTSGCLVAMAATNNSASAYAWSQSSGSGTEWHDERVGTAGSLWYSTYDSTSSGATTTVTADGTDAQTHLLVAATWGPV